MDTDGLSYPANQAEFISQLSLIFLVDQSVSGAIVGLYGSHSLSRHYDSNYFSRTFSLVSLRGYLLEYIPPYTADQNSMTVGMILY